MSNRPNQSDFDDDDFRFDDNDDFDFGNDDDAFNGGLGDDLPPLDDDGDDDGGGRGPSRTFIVIAALMILLFVVGLGALGFFFIRGQGPSDAARTATAQSGTIIAMNLTIVADTTLTAEAALVFAGTQTQEAIALTLTASDTTPRARPNGASATAHSSDNPSSAPVGALNQGEAATVVGVSNTGTGWYLVELPNGATGWVNGSEVTITGDVGSIPSISPPIPTETPTSTLDPTELAAMAFQTETSLTLTAQAQPTIPTETPTSAGISIDAVQQTATRLAELLLSSPTVEGQGGGLIGSPTAEGGFGPLPTALPDTGLFDDMAAGGMNGIGMIALAIVGLVGVIFVSRRMRSSINK
jgi:Bacterial SH3 domain